MNNIVVVSTGRTGTKYLAEYFSKNLDNCVSEHESSYSRLFNILGNMYLCGFVSDRVIKNLWRVLKRPDTKMDADYYIDSNNHLYVAIGIVKEQVSNLKLIHVIRDPRSYVISHLNWMKTRKRSFVANKMTPFWQPNGFLMSNISFKEWYGLSEFDKFCWVWSFKNYYILHSLSSNIPVFSVRFEDLFYSDNIVKANTLKDMLSFVGARNDQSPNVWADEKVNRSKQRKAYQWEALSRNEVAAIEIYCGELMGHFGYGDEPGWKSLLQKYNIKPNRITLNKSLKDDKK